MRSEKFKNKLKSYNRILEMDTLGSFDFFNCMICLDSVDNSRFEEYKTALVSNNNYPVLLKIMPLAVHEITHFIDCTSTVWGMNYLMKMNEAYCSNNTTDGAEYEFYKAKSFLEYIRSLRLPKYYTEIYKSKSPDRPWSSSITMGKQFDLNGKIADKPVIFSKFYNAQGDILVRSPISTISILEASAMSNEMATKLSLIATLNPDDKLIENRIYQREALDYIYNKNITEYSVCVHIVANHLNCNDIFVAFQVCSTITRLVLNFPTSLFDKVSTFPNIHEILGIPEACEFDIRMRTGIKNKNIGILYYLICTALPKDTDENPTKMNIGIETALKKIGLSLYLVQDEASKEIEGIVDKLNNSKLESIKILSKSGLNNFKKIPLTSAKINPSELSIPNIYLSDSTEVSIFENENSLLKNISINDIFNELNSGYEWVMRFSEACME